MKEYKKIISNTKFSNYKTSKRNQRKHYNIPSGLH